MREWKVYYSAKIKYIIWLIMKCTKTLVVPLGGIFDAPSVLVMRMRRYYALQLILGQGFSATMLLLFEEVDRQNAGPSKVLMTERLIFFCD